MNLEPGMCGPAKKFHRVLSSHLYAVFGKEEKKRSNVKSFEHFDAHFDQLEDA